AILGTPAYMAPEQARGDHDRVGPPADVHALGAIFFEMLTGRPPFQGSSTMETLMDVLEKEPPSLRAFNGAVPEALEAVCHRCLAKAPEDRYPDAGALADDLERRWRRAVLSRWFARRTLWAGLAVILHTSLERDVMGWLGLDLGTLVEKAGQLTTGVGAIQDLAQVVMFFTGTLVFYVVPLLAQSVLLIWMGAWVWHSSRTWLLG